MKTLHVLLLALVWVAGCAPAVTTLPVTPSAVPTTVVIQPTPRSTATLAAIQTLTPVPTPTVPLEVTRSLEYCRVDDRPLQLDVYHPVGGATPHPAVIFLHGGGWTQGGRREADRLPVVRALAEAGYYVFSADYRLAPANPFPAQIQDARCAVRWLRANAVQFGVAPNAIAVMGTSAGGHLAALLGVTSGDTHWPDVGGFEDQSDDVQLVVDFFGPADLTGLYEVGLGNLARDAFGASGPDDPALRTASPLTYVDADDQPFLILHGDADSQVPLSQSQRFYEALQAAGVESELIVVKNGPHNFTGSGFTPGWDALNAAVVAFLDAHLR